MSFPRDSVEILPILVNIFPLLLQALVQLSESIIHLRASVAIEWSVRLERVFQQKGGLGKLLAEKCHFFAVF